MRVCASVFVVPHASSLSHTPVCRLCLLSVCVFRRVCCPAHAHIVLHLPRASLLLNLDCLSVTVCLPSAIRLSTTITLFFLWPGSPFHIFTYILSSLKLYLFSAYPEVGYPVCLCQLQSLSTPLLCFPPTLPHFTPEPLPVPAADYLSE